MSKLTAPLEDRNIVLIGLMGAGKSAIGRRLSKHLQLPFADADTEIEKAAGCTIPEIFRLYGEDAFRDGERRVIERLLATGPRVIATGGGAFMNEKTRDAIRARGISIWLKADLEVLFRRTHRRGGRPLLENGNPRETLAQLMETRYPVYAQADITVDSEDGPHDITVNAVIAALEKHLALRPASAGARR